MTQDVQSAQEDANRRVQQYAFVASLARALSEKYGDEGLTLLRNVAKEQQLRLMPGVARKLGLPIGDGGIDDWFKLVSYLDDLAQVEHEIVENTPTRGIYRLTKCPFLDTFKEIFPEMCRKVIIGGEEAISETINPKLRVTMDCLMPEGASYCDFVCEWKDD